MTTDATPTRKSQSPQRLTPRLLLQKLLSPILWLFNTLLPPYEPRIDIEEKLIRHEQIRDHAIIRHFSEIQLGLGVLLVLVSLILALGVGNGFLYILTILGIVVIFSAYEMEEIYVTNRRLLLRRVGLVERFLRVPLMRNMWSSTLSPFMSADRRLMYLLFCSQLSGFWYY